VVEVDQSEAHLDEGARHCQRSSWGHHLDQRLQAPDLQAQLAKPGGQGKGDVRLSSGMAPALHHEAHELLVLPRPREEPPGPIVAVLVQDEDPAGLQGPHHPGQQIPGPGDEGEDPPRPGTVNLYVREALLVQVLLVPLHVRGPAPREGLPERVQEAPGAVEGDDPARGPDDLGKIDGGEPGAAAYVQEGLALVEASARPGVEGPRAPDPMLKAQPVDLRVVGAENIVLLVRFAHGWEG
jgi:hypothetical protein